MGSDLAVRLRSELTESLCSEGALASARWAEAFRSVPRHEFLAEFFAPSEDGSSWRLVSAADGDEWLRMAYEDEAWVTQIDADPRAPRQRGTSEWVTGSPTSSSSAPSLMARMLEALDVTDGSRVLELGTGTGYNAALLSAGLPRGQVSSIDIDPGLIRRATAVLDHLGYTPHLESADGDSAIAPGGDVHDRLIVTYGTPQIPARWLSLLAPTRRELGDGHRRRPAPALGRARSGCCGVARPRRAGTGQARAHRHAGCAGAMDRRTWRGPPGAPVSGWPTALRGP